MKNCWISLWVAVALWAGCKPSDDRIPQANTGNAPRTEAPATATSDRVAAEGKLSATLKQLDETMANLKARATTAGEQAKAEWEARRPQLEAQREAAAKKLEELRASSKDTWEETRTKTEAAFGELEKGFKEAWARLKE